MPLPTITAMPTPPSRGNLPAQFNAAADTFLAAFPGLVSEINAFGAALPAMVNGVDYNGTSTTSLTVGAGSKALTTQTGKNFQVGQFVTVANTATPANYMAGQVTAYNSSTGALTVNVTGTGGAGTFTAWTISLSVASTGYLSSAGGSLSGALSVTGNVSLTGTLYPGNDSNHYLGLSSGAPLWTLDANDFLTYDRTTNYLNVFINNALRFSVYSGGVSVNGLIQVAATPGTVVGAIGYGGGNLYFGDGTAQRTIVTTDTAQSLSSKTLVSPSINGGTIDNATLTAANLTSGLVQTSASVTGGAKFRLPHGTGPTSPVNGDVWSDTSGLKARVNGATHAIAGIVESSITENGGYRVWADGMVECWGYLDVAQDSSASVTFPTRSGGGALFSSWVNVVLGPQTRIGTNESENTGFSANPTTTGFTIYNAQNQTIRSWWQAKGV